MNEYTEKRTVNRAVPIDRRPVVETQYDSVVTEHRPTSGVAIAALVIAAVAAAVVVTVMILNNQQSERDRQLAQERERESAVQQQAVQPSQQPSQQAPIIVQVPQPGAPAQTTPAPSQVVPSESSAPSSIDIEIAVTSKLLDDPELKSHSVDVKARAGTVTLSGSLPNQDLKSRAEKVARTIKGVRDVINNIVVEP